MTADNYVAAREDIRENLKSGAYILWVDYGAEGWRPSIYDGIDALSAAIEQGLASPFVVTRSALRLGVRG